jgi:ABC-type branched-subunit amino acid transport system substrate-binding protein
MMRVLAVMAIMAGIALANGDAAAHSFKVGAMIPLSGPSAETGRQWLDGFLLATREQDAHPDQHSDGHLGGLDVYVLTVDSAGDASAIKNLVAADNPEVLTGPAPAALLAEIRQWLVERPTILIEQDTDSPPDSGDQETMDGGSFQAAFKADYDYEPTGPAVQGYSVARRIAQVVRTAGGDFSDKQALQAAFETTGSQ